MSRHTKQAMSLEGLAEGSREAGEGWGNGLGGDVTDKVIAQECLLG